MPLLLVHLSDAHVFSASNPLLKRADALARTIVAELDGQVESCVIAFTGDATDKGRAEGFGFAASFLREMVIAIRAERDLPIELLLIPGNHDLVLSGDQGLRDVLVADVMKGELDARPKGRIEHEIIAPFQAYFEFATSLTDAPTHSTLHPYYRVHEVKCGGRMVRFHLLNSAWMCKSGQPTGSLRFPLEEIVPPPADVPPEYEVTLLHHPFHWFKQPEVMRPLRDLVEGMSDLILTGHEHIGRSQLTSVHGVADHEYLEGEALQDGAPKVSTAFRVLRLDFSNSKQFVTAYAWDDAESGFVRTLGPAESPLGRNRRRATRAFRLSRSWEMHLDDAELPIMHAKKGKLRLSDFYTYPDLRRVNDNADKEVPKRVKGESLVDVLADSNRSFICGPDRSGKSSLAKRLYVDLHARGRLPVLLDASKLRNQTVDRIARMVEGLISEQYEALAPEAYWQQDKKLRVLLVDDFQRGPKDKAKKAALLRELEKHFECVVLLASEEFFFEEVVSVAERERADNPIWAYEHYRLLPFGFVRCAEFVRRWVGLEGGTDADLAKAKYKQIKSLLVQFLRNNPIPHHPWVVMVIVQQADSPEPAAAAAENGSYGYLLQALINVALAKSTLELPVGGKYRWLGEFARQMYVRNQGVLSETDARAFHEEHKKTFGPSKLDYSRIVEDLETAGVLRVEGGDVSFKQSYTYCYFVAWHLAQRINESDDTAAADVAQLCTDLYHEDTANVLVFLAHLTSSRVVLEAMKGRAAGLFKGIKETDLDRDVQPLNELHSLVEELVLKTEPPERARALLQDQQDDRRAERDATSDPNRAVVLTPSVSRTVPPSPADQKVMEIAATMRTIEILGQVLRNEATGRKIPEMVAIADEIFRLGRRLLGFLFGNVFEHIQPFVDSLGSVYRSHMPDAPKADVAKEVSRYIFNMNLFLAFAVIRQVATAVGEPHLEDVFKQLIEKDGSIPNQFYKLAIDLDLSDEILPIREAAALHDQFDAGKKVEGRDLPIRNNFAQTLVRYLVVDHLHLNHVPVGQRQAMCQKLGLKVPVAALDQTQKRLPGK